MYNKSQYLFHSTYIEQSVSLKGSSNTECKMNNNINMEYGICGTSFFIGRIYFFYVSSNFNDFAPKKKISCYIYAGRVA